MSEPLYPLSLSVGGSSGWPILHTLWRDVDDAATSPPKVVLDERGAILWSTSAEPEHLGRLAPDGDILWSYEPAATISIEDILRWIDDAADGREDDLLGQLDLLDDLRIAASLTMPPLEAALFDQFRNHLLFGTGLSLAAPRNQRPVLASLVTGMLGAVLTRSTVIEPTWSERRSPHRRPSG